MIQCYNVIPNENSSPRDKIAIVLLNISHRKSVRIMVSFVRSVRRSVKFGSLSPEHIRILAQKKLIKRLKIGFK